MNTHIPAFHKPINSGILVFNLSSWRESFEKDINDILAMPIDNNSLSKDVRQYFVDELKKSFTEIHTQLFKINDNENSNILANEDLFNKLFNMTSPTSSDKDKEHFIEEAKHFLLRTSLWRILRYIDLGENPKQCNLFPYGFPFEIRIAGYCIPDAIEHLLRRIYYNYDYSFPSTIKKSLNRIYFNEGNELNMCFSEYNLIYNGLTYIRKSIKDIQYDLRTDYAPFSLLPIIFYLEIMKINELKNEIFNKLSLVWRYKLKDIHDNIFYEFFIREKNFSSNTL